MLSSSPLPRATSARAVLRPFLAEHAAEPVREIALRLAGLPPHAAGAEAKRLTVELLAIVSASLPRGHAKVLRGLVVAAVAEARDIIAATPAAGHA